MNVSIDFKITGSTNTKVHRFDRENKSNSNSDINSKTKEHSLKSIPNNQSICHTHSSCTNNKSLNNEDDQLKTTLPVVSSPKSNSNSQPHCEYESESLSTLSPPPPSMSHLMLVDSNEQIDDDELRTPTAATTTSNDTLDDNSGNNTCKRNIIDNFKNEVNGRMENKPIEDNVKVVARKGYNEIRFELNVESSSSSSSSEDEDEDEDEDNHDDGDDDENDVLTPIVTKQTSQDQDLSQYPYHK